MDFLFTDGSYSFGISYSYSSLYIGACDVEAPELVATYFLSLRKIYFSHWWSNYGNGVAAFLTPGILNLTGPSASTPVLVLTCIVVLR